MKRYIVEVSETAEKDLENILKYLRYNLAGDIIADKYKLLFKQELKNLEDIAGSMPILSQELTGYNNIRKINVRNYIVFYIVDEENSKALVVRLIYSKFFFNSLVIFFVLFSFLAVTITKIVSRESLKYLKKCSISFSLPSVVKDSILEITITFFSENSP